MFIVTEYAALTDKTNMYSMINGQNFRRTITECTCGTHLGNPVTCPVVDHSQLRSNGHQWIHTRYLQDAERMRTRKTTNRAPTHE